MLLLLTATATAENTCCDRGATTFFWGLPHLDELYDIPPPQKKDIEKKKVEPFNLGLSYMLLDYLFRFVL